MCFKGIHGWVSIDALDQHLIDTQSTLDQHLSWHLINAPPTSWSTVGRQSTIFYWCMWVGRHLADYGLTVDQVSIECQPSINQDVDEVEIEMSIEGINCDRGYQLRVLIDSQLQMPLVYMIQRFFAVSVQRIYKSNSLFLYFGRVLIKRKKRKTWQHT